MEPHSDAVIGSRTATRAGDADACAQSSVAGAAQLSSVFHNAVHWADVCLVTYDGAIRETSAHISLYMQMGESKQY